MPDRFRPLPSAALAAALVAALALAGCGENENFDVSSQYGPDPVLPEPSLGFVPDLKVAEIVGWQDGQKPMAPEGLTITAYATDLAHPRTVHTLPNGDVLVVQSRSPEGKPLPRPKDVIRTRIMSFAQGGGGNEKSNLITLLRDTNRDGKVDERSELLTVTCHCRFPPVEVRVRPSEGRTNEASKVHGRADYRSVEGA